MPDLDTELRRLATAFADEAPHAPRYEELRSMVGLVPVSQGRRLMTWMLAALVVVLAAVVVALLITNGAGTRQEPLGPTTFVPCQTESTETFVGPNGKTFGLVPNFHPEGGTITDEDFAAIPDYIAVSCRDGSGVAGYVKKTDMFGTGGFTQANGRTITVYADDGTTVVGHFGGGKGFVGLDENRDSIPSAVTSTVPPTVPRSP
jgi:hypothetical protein